MGMLFRAFRNTHSPLRELKAGFLVSDWAEDVGLSTDFCMSVLATMSRCLSGYSIISEYFVLTISEI